MKVNVTTETVIVTPIYLKLTHSSDTHKYQLHLGVSTEYTAGQIELVARMITDFIRAVETPKEQETT